MNHSLHIYKDAELSARAVADLILEKSLAKQAQGQPFNMAVSGGSTPKYLFTILAEIDEYRDQIPWNTVRFFWVDERCVEPTDPDSNFGMTYDALLQFALVPSKNIFRMKGEDIPENESERYQQILWTEVPARNGFPVFDLVLLGMGEDGHTASIFPDSMDLLNAELSVAIAVHPVSGQKRLTLTGKTLCEANQIAFLVTGANKAEIIKEIITGAPVAQKYPASYIHDCKNKCDFYLDEAAASKL